MPYNVSVRYQCEVLWDIRHYYIKVASLDTAAARGVMAYNTLVRIQCEILWDIVNIAILFPLVFRPA